MDLATPIGFEPTTSSVGAEYEICTHIFFSDALLMLIQRQAGVLTI